VGCFDAELAGKREMVAAKDSSANGNRVVDVKLRLEKGLSVKKAVCM